MKKNNAEMNGGKKFSHFMKHYFGYLVLALCCAFVTVVIVGVSL